MGLGKREEIGRIDAIDGRQLQRQVDARPHIAALQAIDVRAIDAHPLRDVIDAEGLLLAQLLQSRAKLLLHRGHVAEQRSTPMWCKKQQSFAR
jgi:hypothetical protein